MTIQEAIERVCRAEPNTFSPIEMTEWLSRLDMEIWRETAGAHENGASETFAGYSGETDLDTPLLVPPPDDLGIYLNYLEAEIHLRNHETGRYNQAIALFNDAMARYENQYHATHSPISKVTGFKF